VQSRDRVRRWLSAAAAGMLQEKEDRWGRLRTGRVLRPTKGTTTASSIRSHPWMLHRSSREVLPGAVGGKGYPKWWPKSGGTGTCPTDGMGPACRPHQYQWSWSQDHGSSVADALSTIDADGCRVSSRDPTWKAGKCWLGPGLQMNGVSTDPGGSIRRIKVAAVSASWWCEKAWLILFRR